MYLFTITSITLGFCDGDYICLKHSLQWVMNSFTLPTLSPASAPVGRAVQGLAQLFILSLRLDTGDVRSIGPSLTVFGHHLFIPSCQPHVVSGCGVPVWVCCGIQHVWVWLDRRRLGDSILVRTAEEFLPKNPKEEVKL